MYVNTKRKSFTQCGTYGTLLPDFAAKLGILVENRHCVMHFWNRLPWSAVCEPAYRRDIPAT